MVDESIHNNPWDATEERFMKIEEKVVDISSNMALLMEALSNKFETFEEVGSSKLEVGLDEKSIDGEDPKKDSKKRARERETKIQCRHSLKTYV